MNNETTKVDASTQVPEVGPEDPRRSTSETTQWNGRSSKSIKKNESESKKWLKITAVALLAATAIALIAMLNGEEFTVSSFAIRVATGTGSFVVTLAVWKILNKTWDNPKISLITKVFISILALTAAGAVIAASSLTYTSFFGMTPNWNTSGSYWKAMISGAAGLGITFAFSRAMKDLRVQQPQPVMMLERKLVPQVPGAWTGNS